MAQWAIKPQEIRAGGFTLRFGAHDDSSNTCYLQVSGTTEGQQITFNRDGEVLKIMPIQAGDAAKKEVPKPQGVPSKEVGAKPKLVETPSEYPGLEKLDEVDAEVPGA